MTTQNDTKQINPAALTPETAAKMLGLQVEIVQKHISQGAPVGADGSINLIHYAAWLNRRINNGD
ncbi:MAG: hypothetical protein BWY69_01817 [Planctomycetes bacterium ADurb.Bin401]|jgi:hypothetical protein|nr:MAG: hypothetical protein BWY69_01817 [Planctomycetes bacterium ADurb.Bin401]